MAKIVYIFGAFLCVASTGQFLNVSALTLPPRRTTSTTPMTTAAEVEVAEVEAESVEPAAAENTDEPFTTKRSPHLYVELQTVTRFPLPVVNNEIRTTSGATGTLASAKQRASTTPEPTQPPRRSSDEKPLYRLNSSNGQACILLQVDALLTIQYKSTVGEKEEADVYVPPDAQVTGNCDDEKIVVMSLKWDAFVLSWTFAKTPGGERWYVDKIELTYNSSDKHFKHPTEPNKTIRLSTSQRHSSSMLFPTPVGKSYVCTDEKEIPFTDGKHHASVLLRELKLQPFKFKSNDFAAEFSCKSLSARADRDETAPVAVGSTLAAAVLLTITGYAGWRYFKVKKVNYDTME